MASIFDTLLAPFSTSAQDAAAQAQQQGLQNAYNQYSGLNQQAIRLRSAGLCRSKYKRCSRALRAR